MNFYDNAEMYGNGRAETILGKALARLGWKRSDYVLTTKIFFCGWGVNDKFLSRKHIIEGTEAALTRMQVSYVDVVYAHRYDQETPMEEICRAFNWLIEHGKAFYWGTSEWAPQQIMEANECCERLKLIKPVVEEPEYSLLERQRVEADYVPLYDKYGMGTTVWSALGGGFLTGKYDNGTMPEGSRYALATPGSFFDGLKTKYIHGDSPAFFKKLQGFTAIAKQIGCTPAQLALAWVIMNKDISVCIVGGTKPEQLVENFVALDVCKKWTPDLELQIERLFKNLPDPAFNWRYWQNFPPRRCMTLDYVELAGNPTVKQITMDSLRGGDKCWEAFKSYKQAIEAPTPEPAKKEDKKA